MTTVEAGFEERSGGEFLFDFDTFEKIDKLGVFDRAEGRVELIDGRLLEMSPISGDHGEISGGVFFRLKAAVMALGLEDTFKLIVHATLKIGENSAPEPDVFVARPKGDRKYYESRDAVLVVEVSIATRNNDLELKGPLYARAGVPEFWMVEPERRIVRVFREPQSDGTWASTTVLKGDACVSPLFAPQIHIPLTELF
uniref:Putative restriction endonuclease domain-containing protein n=1 Tax=Caulobacter sp. (strain K31) TaxID=366602 RepID=B0SZA1_CAUSK